MKFVCDTCGWIYDSEIGSPKQKIPAGTLPEDISQYFGCPVCGADYSSFTRMETPQSKPLLQRQEHSVWSDMKYQGKQESDR